MIYGRERETDGDEKQQRAKTVSVYTYVCVCEVRYCGNKIPFTKGIVVCVCVWCEEVFSLREYSGWCEEFDRHLFHRIALWMQFVWL